MSSTMACTLKIRGGVMNVSYDVAHTLRSQTKHHEPVVLVYESHNQDSRYNPLGEVCETVSAKYGTGGGNQPIVLKYEETVQPSNEERMAAR